MEQLPVTLYTVVKFQTVSYTVSSFDYIVTVVIWLILSNINLS